MVFVPSSRDGTVQVEIKGVAQSLAFIRRKGKDVKAGADAGVFQAANFIQQEVQESIIGNRAEPKSVDTGRFANSIQVNKKEFAVFEVSTKVPYAVFLEFGTSRVPARMHFRNTLSVNKAKVRKIVEQAIKRKI